MNICVFDTETTSLQKPFCYNVGYVIFDAETHNTIVKHDFVVEQIWHNIPLFATAYYAEKRPLYVKRMRARQATMDKWGYIMQTMIREFKAHDVKFAYAFNSGFDDKVFAYNCDWFKTENPLDNVPILNIQGVIKDMCNSDEYKHFCEENELFTESGMYRATAESCYQFLTKQVEFEEEHTALADSVIEAEILRACIENFGLEYGVDYPVQRWYPRDVEKPVTITYNGKKIFEGNFTKKWIKTDGSLIRLTNSLDK